jgi:hypothetical protein
MTLTTNRNGDGVPLLNGEPLFQIGTLDQG